MTTDNKDLIVAFRALLRDANDDSLHVFLENYAAGRLGMFAIGSMGEEQRATFLAMVARSFPSDWNRAIDLLEEETTDPELSTLTPNGDDQAARE
ncbi:MAG: hypothetical protein FWD17_19300 [Polyangiaceae bacterium]|nr:hypothetical protein [Polyangiaceae bacterium]